MNREELFENIKKKQSYLCVGLDTDLQKIPAHIKATKDPIFEFNKAIIDATKDYCVAYKPNIAFYEALGARGWRAYKKHLIIFPTIFLLFPMPKGEILVTHPVYTPEHISKI